MVDVATLGIAVESSSVPKATEQLSALGKQAGATAAAVNTATSSVGGFATNLQRLNQLAQQAQGLNNLTAVFSRLGPWGIAFGVLADAALNFYRVITENAPKADQLFRDHDALMNRVKGTYDRTTDSARKFYDVTRDIMLLQLRQQEAELRSGLGDASRRSLQGMLSGDLGSKLNALLPGLNAPAIVRAREEFAAFDDAISKYQESVKRGTPAVLEFQDAVSKIGNSNPELQKLAANLVNLAKDPAEFESKLKNVAAAIKLYNEGVKSLNEEERSRTGTDNPAKNVDELTEAWNRQLAAISKRTAAINAEADAVGESAGAHEKLRTVALLKDFLEQRGQDWEKYGKQIEEAGNKAAAARQKLALNQATDNARFDRDTIFMSPSEQRIAQEMRNIYGNEWQSNMDSALAKQMRMNELLRDAKNTATTFAQDFVQGLMAGRNVMEALGSAARNLSAQLANSAITNLFSGNFVGAAVSGIGALVSGMFGRSQQRREEEARLRQQAAAESQALNFRMAGIGLDNSTRDGSLRQLALQQQQEYAQAVANGSRNLLQLQEIHRREMEQLNVDWDKRDADREEQKRQEQARLDEEARKAAVDRQRAYQDRVFAALNDNTTLEGALAEFDRKAAAERAAELEKGGKAMADLEAALAAERLSIFKRFADEQKRAAEELNKFVAGVVKTIKAYLAGLDVGQQSILSPADQLAAARQQFQEQLALAQSGNRDALSNITQYADRLLQQAKNFYASSQGYTDVFDFVKQALNGLTGIPASTVSDADKIVTAVTTASAEEQAKMAQQVAIQQTQVSLLAAINSLTAGQNSTTDRIINAINGLGDLTAQIGSRASTDAQQMIYILYAIRYQSAPSSGGGTIWDWLGFQRGGVIPGYANGGMVGNGSWGMDSVRARYAGGGDIMLAGGEYVMPADKTARYRTALDAMREGKANDNSALIGQAINSQTEALIQDNRELRGSVNEMRNEMRKLTSQMALIAAAR